MARIAGDPTCDWGCGANSPTVGDGVVFDELNSAGEEDAHGIKIISVILDGLPVDLHVERDRLSATKRDSLRTALVDAELKRMVITLWTRRATGDLKHELQIADISMQKLRFWAGRQDSVPAYRFVARRIFPPPPDVKAVPVTPICKIAALETDAIWQGAEEYAIVFAGDRYTAATRTVRDAEPGTTWFNLACAGTAPAKMHLMRHTNAAAVDDHTYTTKVAQRTAMLKMFTADYCGNGQQSTVDDQQFTIDGQRLRYGDAEHRYPDTPTSERLDPRGAGGREPFVSTIEAEWDEHGAVCLDTPRRLSSDAVRAACIGKTIPSCGGPSGVLGWESCVHVISANPLAGAAR